MSNVRFVLRNLPGVRDLEVLIEKIENHPNPNWAPENDELERRADEVSRRLFGLSLPDTGFTASGDLTDEEWSEAYDAWDENFAFAECYFDDGRSEDEQDAAELAEWARLGWDVTDGKGEPHPALHLLQRQIICAAKGLKGRLPGAEMSEAEARDAAEAWAAELLKRKSA